MTREAAGAGGAAGAKGDAAREVVLRLSGISKAFGPVQANDGIDFALHRGEVVAVLGENGAGKTTLMHVLFGHQLPDSGSIEVFGRTLPPGSPQAAIAAGIGMVHQHFTLADNLTVLDNVMLGTERLWRPWTDRASARRRLLELADGFGLAIAPDARVGELSVGQRQRVEIVKALYRGARILILDEPTAVLTPQECESLFATLERFVAAGLSVVFISHKLQEVMAVSERVVVLRAGRKVADLATASTDRAALAELMVGRRIASPVHRPLPPGEPVLQLRGVDLGDGRGGRLLDAVDLELRAHEILGVAGVSGNGQRGLADLVSGLVAPDTGELRLFGERVARADPRGLVRAGVARIPEDRHATGVVGEMAVWENLIAERYREAEFSRAGWLKLGVAERHAEEVIERFDVRCPGPRAITRRLSGGNMQKVILGRVLWRGPRLILACQPTRGLDIGAVTYVHEQLLAARERGAGVLLISEDLDEVLSLADRLVVIHGGRVSPAFAAGELEISQIGLMMAGHTAGTSAAAGGEASP